MAEPLPGGLTTQAISDGIDKILRTGNWDEITVKVVLRKLEQQLLPPDSDGALKAHKKFVKAVRALPLGRRAARTPAAARAMACARALAWARSVVAPSSPHPLHAEATACLHDQE